MELKNASKIKKTRLLSSKRWKTLRNSILHRDDGKCFICGCTGNIVHHIIYRKADKTIVFSEWNLITLCKSCHWKVYRLGYGTNLLLKLQEKRENMFNALRKHISNVFL